MNFSHHEILHCRLAKKHPPHQGLIFKDCLSRIALNRRRGFFYPLHVSDEPVCEGKKISHIETFG